MNQPQPHDIDHANAERLAALLQLIASSLPADQEPVPIDTLDGYLTALVVGPVEAATPLPAMDALFGIEWAEALHEQELTDEFMDVLHKRWTEINESLNPEALSTHPEQMALTPLITEFDEATKADLLAQGVLTQDQLAQLPPPGVMWVEGFMRAVDDAKAAWYAHEEDSEPGQMLDAMLMGIAAVALPPGAQREAYIAEQYEPEDVVDQNVLLDDALFSAQDLRLFWLQPAAGQMMN